MDILQTVQKNYPAIHKAASAFLTRLSGTGIVKDVAVSAEMAGLMLLRASSADLQNVPPGSGIIGAISDEAMNVLNRFVYSFAISNRLNPKEIDFAAIPPDAKAYLPELTRYEAPFYETCKAHGIEKEMFPFTAAAAAGKLVLAGNQLKMLEPRIGLAILLLHVVTGSKTVPYPVK